MRMRRVLRQCIAARGAALLTLSAALPALVSCYDPMVPVVAVATQDDEGAGDVVAVTAGEAHTCVLRADGSAWCWGSNEFSQLGIAPGTTTCQRGSRRIACEPRPQAVATSMRFRAIGAGGEHTCALGTDDRIYCWGDNLYGQLGDPSVRDSDVPIPVSGTARFVDLAVGGEHTCGLRTDGVLMCWGANDIGQLGTANTGSGSSVPTTVQTLLRFASVSAGPRRTCARTTDGSPYCWGAMWVERSGGVELVRAQAQPLRILQIGAVQSVSVGMNSTCAVDRDGDPFCWEANPTGSIGDGTTLGSTSPEPVSTTLVFAAISSGRAHTCGIAADGMAWCWGEDTLGQLGIPTGYVSTRCTSASLPCLRVPARVSGWRVFGQISAGQGDHTCGVTIRRNVYCWGAGSMGQLGDGGKASGWSPVRADLPM